MFFFFVVVIYIFISNSHPLITNAAYIAAYKHKHDGDLKCHKHTQSASINRKKEANK